MVCKNLSIVLPPFSMAMLPPPPLPLPFVALYVNAASPPPRGHMRGIGLAPGDH